MTKIEKTTNTQKIKDVGSYLGASYVLLNILVHFFPSLSDIEAELLALINGILVFGKMIITKWLNERSKEV